MMKIKVFPVLFFTAIIFANSTLADEVSINNLQSLITITLTPQTIQAGSVESGNIDFCVIAEEDDLDRDNFKFTINQASTPGNVFKLYNGSNEIPITMELGSYYNSQNQSIGLDTLEEMKPNESSNTQYKGGLSCSDGNYGSSRMRFSFNTDLQLLTSGTYEANMTMEINAGNKTVDQAFTIRVVMPSLVQISRLHDISLSDHGTFGYAGETEFCTYSSTGDFWISAAGMTSDNNNFLLHNGASSIPYNVTIGRNDFLGTPVNVSPNEKVDIQATPTNCEVSDNAQVTLVVPEGTADAAQSGTYQGILYLTVEPK